MASIRSTILRELRDTYARFGVAIPQGVDVALARGDAWTDLSHLLQLSEVAGPAVAHELSRQYALSSRLEGALAVLERQAFKFMGRRPQAMMQFFPGAFAMTSRGIGNGSYVDGASGGRFDIANAPSIVTAHESYRAGVCGSLVGLLQRLGWEGEVTAAVRTTTASMATISFTMRWWRPLVNLNSIER